MTISKIFKSTFPSMSYFFLDGVQAPFLNGKYVTDVDYRIAELTAEVGAEGRNKSKHPHIYIDEDEKEIDSEALSPLEIIKAEALTEAKADILRALDAKGNISASEAKDFVASLGNSNTIADGGTARSDSASGDMNAAVSVTTPAVAITSRLAGLKAGIPVVIKK